MLKELIAFKPKSLLNLINLVPWPSVLPQKAQSLPAAFCKHLQSMQITLGLLLEAATKLLKGRVKLRSKRLSRMAFSD
jgi:hypothetical protein